ncbi:MAG: hypothetical protein ACK4NQ_06020 [Fimbriimonadaceae bacterium]
MKTLEAIQAIDDAAKALDLNETRFVERVALGEFARQGDIYIVAIDAVPAGCKPSENRQLAPGTTQGSRHIAEGAVEIYHRTDHGRIVMAKNRKGGHAIGPVIVAKDFFTVTHPEHAHVSLPPGVYQVCGQIDPVTLRRVQD